MSGIVTAPDHLRSFVERVERLEEEIKTLNGMTHSPTKTSDLDPPKAAREIEATTDRRGNAGRRSRRPHLVSNHERPFQSAGVEQ